jgi:hypothetical protein
MAAQTALVLNTKSYAPRGKDSGNIASWALVGDATFGGATSIASSKVGNPTLAGVTVVTFKLKVPKAATASSTCACEGEVTSQGLLDIVVKVPSNFTASERDDFTKRIQSLVASAVFTAATTNLEGAW